MARADRSLASWLTRALSSSTSWSLRCSAVSSRLARALALVTSSLSMPMGPMRSFGVSPTLSLVSPTLSLVSPTLSLVSFSSTAAATIFRARSSAVMLGLSPSSSYSLSASSLPCPLLADALHATLVLGVPPAGLNTGLALDFGDEVTWDPFGAADFSADTGRSPSLASTRWMASSSEPGGRLYLSNRSSAVFAPTLRSGVVTPVIVPLFCSVVIQEGESVGAIAKGAGRRPDPFVWGIGVRDALSSLSLLTPIECDLRFGALRWVPWSRGRRTRRVAKLVRFSPHLHSRSPTFTTRPGLAGDGIQTGSATE